MHSVKCTFTKTGPYSEPETHFHKFKIIAIVHCKLSNNKKYQIGNQQQKCISKIQKYLKIKNPTDFPKKPWVKEEVTGKLSVKFKTLKIEKISETKSQFFL